MRVLAFSLFSALLIVRVWSKRVASIDERWVCNIKTSCRDCLQFSHCSWCPTENRCFSDQLPGFGDFCKNNSLVHKDYGLSLDEFAECACTPKEELKQNCRPQGMDDVEECYGRGRCLCGRCSCFSPIDQQNPSKVVFGEYCQWDNFSCEGPRCNEGPYSIAEELEKDLIIDIPAEVAE